MSTTRNDDSPIIDHILHPTDFSEDSQVAFNHSLKMALAAKASLTLLHDGSGTSDDYLDFPGVRQTLERWGMLPPNSPRSAVPNLGIEVRKVVTSESNPVKGVMRYLEEHPVDLIVLATHQHEGRIAWMRNAVAQPVARKSGQATLFIPQGRAGFVSVTDGSVSLKSVLIPLASAPHPQAAVEAAARLVRRLNCPEGSFHLLHVGEPETMPSAECPEVAGWVWNTVTRTGDVVHSIVDTAHKRKADLVVMATSGRRGFLDALRGSHTEQVLRQVPVPLLTVPSGSRAEQSLESGLK
jgi:nucleotide-binding universal stress UspA family protein